MTGPGPSTELPPYDADAADHRSPTPYFRGGRGEALVLLHGLAMSWRAWGPVIGPLSVDHEVFAPTLPGHRGGPKAPPRVSIAWLADQLETTLDELGYDQVHLVGNSLGGWLALELARRGRALSVTALAPGGAWRHAGDQVRVQALLRTAHAMNRLPLTDRSLAPALRTRAGRRALFRRLMERGDRMSVPEAVGLIRDGHACRVVPAVLRAARTERFDGLPADTSCPVRVVWGRHDRIIPYRRHGRPMLDRLPSATHLSVPGAGHVPMHDVPELLTSLVRDQVVSGSSTR